MILKPARTAATTTPVIANNRYHIHSSVRLTDRRIPFYMTSLRLVAAIWQGAQRLAEIRRFGRAISLLLDTPGHSSLPTPSAPLK